MPRIRFAGPCAGAVETGRFRADLLRNEAQPGGRRIGRVRDAGLLDCQRREIPEEIQKAVAARRGYNALPGGAHGYEVCSFEDGETVVHDFPEISLLVAVHDREARLEEGFCEVGVDDGDEEVEDGVCFGGFAGAEEG